MRKRRSRKNLGMDKGDRNALFWVIGLLVVPAAVVYALELVAPKPPGG